MSIRCKNRSVWIPVCLVLMVLSVIVGCGSSPTTFPVSGKVVNQKSGKPFPGGTITFQLDKDPTMNATGEIQKDGSFSLTTHYVSGNNAATKPGAPLGEYSVTVEPSYGAELPTVIKGTTVTQKFTVKEGDNSFTVEVAN